MADQTVTSLKFQVGGPMREWLEAACAESGNSLAEEIRQRLGDAFRFDQNLPTKCLSEDVFLLAMEVKKETGDHWYESERARATFAAAVVDHIMSHGKEDAPYSKDPDCVETEESIVGRTIARMFRRK